MTLHALGTQCMLQYRCHDRPSAENFQRAAVDWLRGFEASYSRFIPSSKLSLINAAAGKEGITVDPEFAQMLDLCEQLYRHSRGINDPTSLPLTRLWDRAAEQQIVPSHDEIAATLDLVGWKQVQRRKNEVFLPKPGMCLDFGGFGKEYAVDALIQLARDHGIRDALIDLGRDIATLGAPHDLPFWVVGVENVNQPDHPLLRGALKGEAMASSGNYRRFRTIAGQRYGHIIDPRSGRPATTDITAATCIASSCLMAGFCSRTIFTLGMPQGLDWLNGQSRVEGIIQTTTTHHRSRHFYRYEIPEAN